VLVPLALVACAATARADGTLVNLADGAPSGYLVVDWTTVPDFEANLLNDLGDVVGLAYGVELASDQSAHTMWFRWSGGNMTFPWGMDGTAAASPVTIPSGNQAGTQYVIFDGQDSGTSIFGLDNSGAIYASGEIISPDNPWPSANPTVNFRLSRDGLTLTPLPGDLNYAGGSPYGSQVTMDGRAIVNFGYNQPWGNLPMEVYRWNDETGVYDGPFTADLPAGTSFPAQSSFVFASNGGQNASLTRVVNNRLEILLSGTDSTGTLPQSYIYQIRIRHGAATLKLVGTPGPNAIATAISERGWVTGYFGQAPWNVTSNFIYRPEGDRGDDEDHDALEILNPLPDGNINPWPFAINRDGTVGLTAEGLEQFPGTANPYIAWVTLSRAPNGTYTQIGLGGGTIFPSSLGNPLFGNVVAGLMNEKGEIAGTHSWVNTDINYTFAGFASWLWTPPVPVSDEDGESDDHGD
jgi:hypothetical protein